MDVKIENDMAKNNTVEEGDIIVYQNGSAHVITKKNIDYGKGLNGLCLNDEGWTSNPQGAVLAGRATLYKKEDWELVLRRKNKEEK